MLKPHDMIFELHNTLIYGFHSGLVNRKRQGSSHGSWSDFLEA